MLNAREVFLTSATSIVTAVTKINETVIADGQVGAVSTALREDYLRYAAAGTA